MEKNRGGLIDGLRSILYKDVRQGLEGKAVFVVLGGD